MLQVEFMQTLSQLSLDLVVIIYILPQHTNTLMPAKFCSIEKSMEHGTRGSTVVMVVITNGPVLPYKIYIVVYILYDDLNIHVLYLIAINYCIVLHRT